MYTSKFKITPRTPLQSPSPPVQSYPNGAEVTRIAATEDAAARNRQITEAYWKLSAEVERRILGNANWCTFATWASQQAGVTIRHEDMTQLLREGLQSSREITVNLPDKGCLGT